MKKRSFLPARLALVLFLLILAATLVGCKTTRPKKWWEFWLREAKPTNLYPPPDIMLPPPPDVAPLDTSRDPTMLGQNLPVDEPTGTLREVRPTEAPADAVVSELQIVYFDYDSSDLSAATVAALQVNAEWLKQHPGVTVRIEGHCDERGTVEYNYALGARRANTVRDYLARLGVAPERMETISYGKERPIDPANTEEAWAKNRRAQFFIW